MEIESTIKTKKSRLSTLLAGLIPLFAMGLILFLFNVVNPLALFNNNLPVTENIVVERIQVLEYGFDVTIINSGPQPVQIAQVMVDDAYWLFYVEPDGKLSRLGKAVVHIPYQWIEGEPHRILLVTNTGLTFEGIVPVATLTPQPGLKEFLGYGLLGIYVGVIPVTLGLLWYPALKRLTRKWLGFILALTVGLLVFLLVDTFLEVLEIGATLPGVFQGIPLALFAALLTWLAIMALSKTQKRPNGATDSTFVKGKYLATLLALSIGLHNFGEGLAVGAAFAQAEAALGTFLVIGFILHNITEGVGIAAPLVQRNPIGESQPTAAPSLLMFAGLSLLAGFPAVLGTWIGGFAYSPLLGTIFLGIGLGAIWQVIVEVIALLRRYAEHENASWITWINLAGFMLGLAIMYFTAFMVKI